MRIDILTLFPEMFSSVIGSSMLKRASERGLVQFNLHNIRDYSENKHKNADDYPFGGGAGMVMLAQPVIDCLQTIQGTESAYKICLTPRGRTLTQKIAAELAEKPHLMLVCGHYEGMDERIMQYMDDEISIGDYVLTGGELPAMVLADCVIRFIPEVLGSGESAQLESFSDGLLEYPQYTRPADFRGMKVPDVLLNGHHALIEKWRREQSLIKTMLNRPDLLEKAELSVADLEFIERYKLGLNQE